MSSPIVSFRSGEAKVCEALRYEEGDDLIEFSIDPRSNVLALPKDEDWHAHFPSVIRDKKETVVALLVQFCRKADWIVVKDNVDLEQTLPLIHARRESGRVFYCGNLARVSELDLEQREADFEAKRPII